MTDFEIMKYFVDNKRTTTYFRGELILRICVAYKILEYFEPDSYFPPKNINQDMLTILKGKDLDYENDRDILTDFVQEANIYGIDLGCSSGTEYIYMDAAKLIKYIKEKKETERIVKNKVILE